MIIKVNRISNIEEAMLSLKSLKPDVWTIDDDYNYERAITENMYEINEIIEIITRIKQGMEEFTIAN